VRPRKNVPRMVGMTAPDSNSSLLAVVFPPAPCYTSTLSVLKVPLTNIRVKRMVGHLERYG
jgi:hypothetical protein